MKYASQILGVMVLAIAASCGGSTSDGGYGGVTNPGTGGGTTQPTQTTSVAVSDNQFSPASIQVSPGATVRWTWAAGSSLHNVTFTSGTSSANLDAGATFTRTFAAAGTFTYQCTLHPAMTGAVTVQ